jgi:hypothetical protein
MEFAKRASEAAIVLVDIMFWSYIVLFEKIHLMRFYQFHDCILCGNCLQLIDVGFFVCLDSFLSLCTVMPARILMFLWQHLVHWRWVAPSESVKQTIYKQPAFPLIENQPSTSIFTMQGWVTGSTAPVNLNIEFVGTGCLWWNLFGFFKYILCHLSIWCGGSCCFDHRKG